MEVPVGGISSLVKKTASKKFLVIARKLEEDKSIQEINEM